MCWLCWCFQGDVKPHPPLEQQTTPPTTTIEQSRKYLLVLPYPRHNNSLQSREKTWHVRSLPRIVISTLSWRATKRRRLHRTKPHLPKRSARTRPSSPARASSSSRIQPCPPPPTAATPRPNTSHISPPDVFTSQPPKMEGSGSNQEQSLDNAIRALREKKQVPEIDFTIHEMEDGSQVNTQERVCKGE